VVDKFDYDSHTIIHCSSIMGNMFIPLLIIHGKTLDDAIWDDEWRDGEMEGWMH
jgi:hypothetical protein